MVILICRHFFLHFLKQFGSKTLLYCVATLTLWLEQMATKISVAQLNCNQPLMSTTSNVMAWEHYSSSLRCCCDIFFVHYRYGCPHSCWQALPLHGGQIWGETVAGKGEPGIDWTHTVSASHTHCVTTDDEEERLSPNGCQAELGKGWGGIMSTKSTIFHQWGDGFSSKQTQGWPGLTSLFSLCFKDMALQIASEFLCEQACVRKCDRLCSVIW